MGASQAGGRELLSVRSATVRFGDRYALREVDLGVRAGEFVALTGPNGSGKTTLMRAALGLEPLASGAIALAGVPLSQLAIPERARRAAWLPQEEPALQDVRVGDYVLYGRTPYLGDWHGETAIDREVAARSIAQVGLSDRTDSGLRELSGGERQRILLARALAQETPLLMLDEPTAHLDIAYQLDLLDRVRSLCRDGQHAALAALHDLNLAARFADRVLVLSHGRLVVEGPPREVLSEELLRTVWGVAAVLREDPRTGLPYLLPRLAASVPARPSGAGELPGPVHVIGGGGAASRLMRQLLEEGFAVSAGPLNVLDTDAEVADELGVPYPAEVPFASFSPEVRARHRELLAQARAVVVTPFAVGPTNLSNLEDPLPFASTLPMWLMNAGEIRGRDFAQGRGTELVEQLLAHGALDLREPAELLSRLRTLLVPSPTPAPAAPGTGPGA